MAAVWAAVFFSTFNSFFSSFTGYVLASLVSFWTSDLASGFFSSLATTFFLFFFRDLYLSFLFLLLFFLLFFLFLFYLFFFLFRIGSFSCCFISSVTFFLHFDSFSFHIVKRFWRGHSWVLWKSWTNWSSSGWDDLVVIKTSLASWIVTMIDISWSPDVNWTGTIVSLLLILILDSSRSSMASFLSI